MPISFSIKAPALRRILSGCRHAISTEETRYYLNGIYLHAIKVGGELKLRGVATDGHRLARIDTECPRGAEGVPGVILPTKFVCRAIALLDLVKEVVRGCTIRAASPAFLQRECA